MSVQEKIYAWKSVKNLQGKLYMQSVTIDLEGLRVLLVRESNSQEGIILDFFAGIRSYRVTDELCTMHLLKSEPVGYKGLQFTQEEIDSPWSFFIIENSEYLKWVSYQSDTISDCLGIVHYVIWTEDWIIDILSCGEPTIKFVNL